MADETTQGAGETPGQGETPDFETWLGEQDETVRGVIDGHTQGLRAALDTERTQRKDLAKQLRELTGKLDQNSDAAQQLGKLSGQLESAQKRADFVEAAARAGCSDVRLAWLAAQADDLTVDDVKAAYPQLFMAQTRAATHAGNGSQSPVASGKSMNNFIRRAAGR